MREQELQQPSGKQVFQRGLLRENPVLMQCLGLFPAIMLATSLKAAAIVALSSAVLLIVMEFLTALLFKKLPFWLRIGLYALLSFGILAGGLAACERFFPNLLGTLSGYLPLLAVNALIVFRCETCAARQSMRVSLLDALGASLGYAAVLLLLGFFRELLGSGTVLGRPVSPLPQVSGMLMPFGGFLLLGFMAAAVKWLYHLRHRGEAELATPVAHVDEDDLSVLEPLARVFRKKAAGQASLSEKPPKQKPARKAPPDVRREPDAPEGKQARPVRQSKKAEARPVKSEQTLPVREPVLKPSPVAQRGEKKAASTPEKKRPERREAEKKAPPKPAAPVSRPRQEEMESFADVLEALNRRRAEQERKAQAGGQPAADEKGEEQP